MRSKRSPANGDSHCPWMNSTSSPKRTAFLFATTSAAALARPSSRFFGELGELLGLLLGGERVDEVVELAVHDAVDLVQGEIDAVVGDAALREVVGADALGAVARADQRLAGRGGLRLL